MRTCNLLLLLVVAGIAVVYPVATSAEEFWYPIDVNDPHVQELGKWAVIEHVKKAHDGLTFSKVTRGEEQDVGGVKYRLSIEAVQGSGTVGKYSTVLIEEPRSKTRNLISFAPAAN
ncbi:putative cysteine proteinase inhibitor 7 [Brachypodium distachyon]|uniref:Cystatin domain-containing protein n=1 Tax=Brachypodium distachyon TaxID=15368 RepID=I1H8A8_BRADI|nr:putative cysteine proteinase inhibitor 7 [Brachypodium distachyon]KQK22992.1 hypothetical protein BRADI_1g70530v3 [Brachypodium distachyon]|eukprot:XP_010230219.1 putative cysteine proteinase inhibitor 7 [Brachypodium distachyon]